MTDAVAIPHPYNRRAPDWLSPDETVLDRAGGIGAQALFVHHIMWDDSLTLYLRGDHPFAPVLAAGLTPWNPKLQGDGPPNGWEYGGKVMFADGEIVDTGECGVISWLQRDTNQIIGYERAEPLPSSPSPPSVEALLEKAAARLSRLERAATMVHRLGAATGPQWSSLSGELILARATLSEIEGHRNAG